VTNRQHELPAETAACHTVTTKNGVTMLAVVWGRTEPVLEKPARRDR